MANRPPPLTSSVSAVNTNYIFWEYYMSENQKKIITKCLDWDIFHHEIHSTGF